MRKLESWKTMFSIWSKNFRGGFQKIKTSCRRLWISLPKFLCWEIWLAHNRAIFNQELDNPNIIYAKAKGLLQEYLNSKSKKIPKSQCLEGDEKYWI
jgi:hypothetical protein